MRRSWRLLASGLLAAALFVGCAKKAPAPESAPADFSSLSVPLEVREFQVVHTEEYRAIFLKLSRLPDSVGHREQSDPASIILEISGPTGSEAPEEVFPGGDILVSRVRIARSFGVLHVAIDLASDDAPDYSVHTMADWIMVRLAPAAG
jgi:hypothetical protein